MKLATEKTKFESNIDQSNSVSFGIGDISMVIDILRNRLYENKIQTLVQEYISNARDANREISQKEKIIVKFPSQTDLEFSVRDFGPGVSPDRIKDVFVLYGASTKRHTNGLTGGFGIGSKSAWSYCDSFEITTYIDGIERLYVAHVGANKIGQLDLMYQQETNEANGTKITVRVNKQDVGDFGKAIIRATMFWEENEYPSFINADFWQRKLKDSRKIGTARFMGSNLSGLDHSDFTGVSDKCIIIDGIPYPTPNISLNEANFGANYECLNVFVPNGLVQVSASREKIDTSDVSKKGLKEIFIAAKNSYQNSLIKWESDIVDIQSLMKANDMAAGFILSSKKSFDFVKLLSGNYVIQNVRDCNDGDERLFDLKWTNGYNIENTNKIQDTLKKYYMVKRGQYTLKEIRHWIRTNNIGSTSLMVILAQKEEEIEIDNEQHMRFKRNENLAQEIIATAEKIGYVNIETVLPKEFKERKERKKGVKISGMIYRLDGEEEEKLEIENVKKLKNKGKFLYFIGRKGEYPYKNFIKQGSYLQDLGVIEEYFRITEKNKKNIEDDSRFVAYRDFVKNFSPTQKEVISYIKRKSIVMENSSILDNLCKNLSGENIYRKLLRFSISRYSHVHDYEIDLIFTKNNFYKNVLAECKVFSDFVCRNFGLLRSQYTSDLQTKEYVEWRMELIEKNGTMPKLPILEKEIF